MEIRSVAHFSACGYPVVPAPFVEACSSSIELHLQLCQKSVGCACVGLFLGSLFHSTDLCVYSSTNSHRNMYLDVQSSYLHNHPEWKQCKCPTGEWINKLWNIHSKKKKWTIDSHNNLNIFQRHWGSEMKLSYLHLLQATKKPKVHGNLLNALQTCLRFVP